MRSEGDPAVTIVVGQFDDIAAHLIGCSLRRPHDSPIPRRRVATDEPPHLARTWHHSPSLIESTVDDHPLFAPFLELATSVGTQSVDLSAAPVRSGDPTSPYEAMPFEPVQYGVEHAIGPFKLPVGESLDLLENRVAVAFSTREDGQNEGSR